MSTKKKSPATEQARKTAKREQEYARLQAAKRKHAGFTEHVEAKRSEATARRFSHPEEHGGPDEQFAPKPGTVAHELKAEAKSLMSEPNKYQAEVDEARSAYNEAELDERTHRARHLQQIIDEENADLEADDAELVAALRKVAELTGRRLAKADEVRGLIAATDGLSGQDFEQDPRVLDWNQFATRAAEERLAPPGITPAGHHQLEIAVKAVEGHE